jgi:acetyltransferase-like isoleucine patch superfamily enzyme
MKLKEEPLVRAALVGRFVRPYRRRQFAAFGADSLLIRPKWLHRTGQMSIGARTVVMPGAWLTCEPEGRIEIGDECVFRNDLTIGSTVEVVIEDKVLFAAYISIIDCDHTVTDADTNPQWNPTVSAPIRIGRGSWLAERVTVTKGSTIGERCIIGAHSVVRGEIPDFSVAVGSPARVVGSTRPD